MIDRKRDDVESNVEDASLNGYVHVGHGPRKVLAMGGWFGEASDWLPVVDSLDHEEFSFLLFDYRGYGRSRHLSGDFTFEESARDAIRLADHLGWDRFSLVGHSMGGAAVQRVLLAAGERIEKIIAVTAVPACSSRMDAQRLSMFEAAVADVAKREFIINFSTGGRLPAAWVRSMAQRSMENSVPQAFAAYLREWATVDFSDRVRDSRTPLQVLVGEFDPTLTADLMQRTWLSWYSDGTLTTLTNSGHYPMHEVPLAMAATIQEFLRR